MSSNFLIAAMFLGASLPAFSWMQEGTIINLKVSKAVQDIKVDYPGQLSGVCGLKLATSQDLSLNAAKLNELAKNIIITDGFSDAAKVLEPVLVSEVSFVGQELQWKFAHLDTFLTTIQIKTANGESLGSVVDSITGENEAAVVLVATGCNK